MTRPRLLIDEHIRTQNTGLEQLGELHPYDPHTLAQRPLDGYQGLICRTTTRVDASLLDRAPDLRVVASNSAGTDHLDLDALRARGIGALHAAGCNASAVADYVAGALLRLMTEMRMPRDASLGVIGLGQVGRRVARRAEALGLTVRRCDPPLAARLAGTPMRASSEAPQTAGPFAPATPLPPPPDAASLLSLDALLAASDLVTLHVPLTETGEHPTRRMISGARLATHGVRGVINTARGPVTHNLHHAEGVRLVLDVYEEEPRPADAILTHPMASRLTPHIAGYGRHAKWAAAAWLVPQLAAALELPPPSTPAFVPDPPGPYRVDMSSLPEGDAFTQAAHVVEGLEPFHDIERRLRDLRGLENVPRGRAFAALRTSYPLRLEWQWRHAALHGTTAHATAMARLASLLRAAGIGHVTCVTTPAAGRPA